VCTRRDCLHAEKIPSLSPLDPGSRLSAYLWAHVEHYQVMPDFSIREIIVSSAEEAAAACLSPRSREL